MRIAIELSGHWDLVEPTGELLRKAAAVALGEGPVAEQVGIASRELLENTVKYSRDSNAKIVLEVGETSRRISITTENQPDLAQVESLEREIAALSNMCETRALQHYVEKMGVAARAAVGKSGLGLARIRYECGMDLSLETDDGNVRVTARRQA